MLAISAKSWLPCHWKAPAITERANKTLKYEWLKRVGFIKGIDHLTEICKEFEIWYNRWRPHMTLDGNRPDDVYFNNKPDGPGHDAKTVPCNIEQHYFRHTRIIIIVTIDNRLFTFSFIIRFDRPGSSLGAFVTTDFVYGYLLEA